MERKASTFLIFFFIFIFEFPVVNNLYCFYTANEITYNHDNKHLLSFKLILVSEAYGH